MGEPVECWEKCEPVSASSAYTALSVAVTDDLHTKSMVSNLS